MSEGTEAHATGVLGRRTVLVLAVVCGCAVANTYFPQSLVSAIASGLHVSRSSAALIVTMTQLGYAAGIFLLVPLGDRIAHRRLTVCLLLASAVGLFVAGTTSSFTVLAVAGIEIGLTTVTAQVIIPMAVGLVPRSRQGTTAGQLMSGIMTGILLARAFSGFVGAWLGWRAPYLAAGGLAVAGAALLMMTVPATRPHTDRRYLPLLGESLVLFARLPALRRSCLYQGLIFGAFTAAWTAVALLLSGPHYGLGPDAVGLLALAGAGSVFATPVAGRLIDRIGPDPVNLACLAMAPLAAAILLLGTRGGGLGWVGLGLGMLVLDSATQCCSAASQARVLALMPDRRSRLNTAYMTCTFIGGTAGSYLGVLAYDAAGWHGDCVLIAAAAVVGLIRAAVGAVRSERARPAAVSVRSAVAGD